MVRPTPACRVGVALAALAAAQGEETQGSAGHVAFCIETPNGPNTRVRIPMSAGGPQSCTTMYCLHEGDTADSGNCRCQRDDGQRCLDLSYAPPEPEPEPEDSLASTEQRCAQLPEGSAEWFAENCDTMEQPGLVWLLLLLGIYLLIAMATARMYRRYRAKNEALWEEAKANGTVKIEIDEEEMRCATAQIRLGGLSSRPARRRLHPRGCAPARTQRFRPAAPACMAMRPSFASLAERTVRAASASAQELDEETLEDMMYTATPSRR